ncbi:MAG: permease-like cell division protein FtsX [Vicinamibacterales bacterium]
MPRSPGVSMLVYSLQEAAASLVRGGRAAAMSMGTIATAFLALGGFMLVTGNLQRVVQQWMESAEVSVYLRDDVSREDQAAIESALRSRAGVVGVDYLSKDAALGRFTSDFPSSPT